MEQMIHLMNALANLLGKDVVIGGVRMWLVMKETEEFLAAHPNLVFGMAPAAAPAALCATPCGTYGSDDLPSPRPEASALCHTANGSGNWSMYAQPQLEPLDMLAAVATAALEPEDELEQLATAVAEFALAE